MIEDIEYLNNNCEKDTVSIYIDSDLRNREYYPEPSEFTVDLQQPFRFVNGLEVLDASIPTTMYNIDTNFVYNAITIVRKVPGLNIDRREYFIELSYSYLFGKIFEEKKDFTSVYVCNESVLNTYQITDKINNDDNITGEYYVAIRKQFSNVTITEQKSLNNTDIYYIKYNDINYGIINSNDNQIIINTIKDDNYYLSPISSSKFNIIYFEFYKLTNTQQETIAANLAYTVNVENYIKSIEEGNYDISTLRNDLNGVWNDTGVFIDTTTTVERKQGKYRIYSNDLIIYNSQKSPMSKFIGFDLLPSSKHYTMYETCKVRDNKYIYMGLYNQEDDGSVSYSIIAPGLVNLLGERFVVLRCKEIEDHLLGSFAYITYTPGIGMFKLAASYNDITNLRFDYVNLVRKPFHPIGKLNKLTFRFETSRGDLYDFKGVNIQMLLLIKFLVPTQKFKFGKSLLNPNYDPNFMNYMSSSKAIQYKEDSDEEEEFDDRTNYELYKKEMDKYDYSTSEDEDEDSNDSEVEVQLSKSRFNH